MTRSGWKHGLKHSPSLQGEGQFPIAAYSEFLPPIRYGRLPYGTTDTTPFREHDPAGWWIDESEWADELSPGLRSIACQVTEAMMDLGRGEPTHRIAKGKLHDNPYWPAELAERAGSLDHERYLLLMPLALSKTQDDKGRRRWTLFGCSEQGPSRAFWNGFDPDDAATSGPEFIRRLLIAGYGEAPHAVSDLSRAGFRILPRDDEALPDWAVPYIISDDASMTGVRYLLSFRSFATLPAPVRRAYFGARLHLVPFPGSLLVWGIPGYQRLHSKLPLAAQVPLLHLLNRHEGPRGIRVPQSGWLQESRPGQPRQATQHGPLRETFRRTHRHSRVARDVDELGTADGEDRMAHVLFSTAPDDLGLYGKPMARNSQLWTHDFAAVLDGPRATPEQLHAAARQLAGGGLFGYRMQYPAMRLGSDEVYWHLPLVAFPATRPGEVTVLDQAPLGFLTAYDSDKPEPSLASEFRPRVHARDAYEAAVRLRDTSSHPGGHRLTVQVRKILEVHDQIHRAVPHSFACRLVSRPRQQTLEQWVDKLPEHADDQERGLRLADELRAMVQPPASRPLKPRSSAALTFSRSSRRSFEVGYWKTIAMLSGSRFPNKNNADVILDEPTRKVLRHHERDLDPLGDELLRRHGKAIADAGLTGRALAGSARFAWRTDFRYPWMGGWLKNQPDPHERDLVVVIPGRDRRRAVFMADHYDTAYRADRFEKSQGGSGARVAAPGADDNGSATAALLLAAPILLELSRNGRLGCDVWLIHLTGEEFPADCLGARSLCQRLVEGTLTLELPDGGRHDLSGTRVQGGYVLDMVSHNSERDPDVFQIAPGRGRDSLWLAYQAHLAAETWNASTTSWNRGGGRRGRGQGRRSATAAKVPPIARHPALSGEVRLPDDPRSTLYNTDGQVFSDAGVPVVLLMENYDINRTGYHDSQDTMANIDLDYGAALAAIAIESVARAATEVPGEF